jgi:uncharacterized protein (DUF1330 family)
MPADAPDPDAPDPDAPDPDTPRPGPAPETGPVYLVVTAMVADPVRMGAYARALAASGLYEKHGGRYVTIGRPLVDLEAWDGRSVVVAEFPSLARAQAFWSDPVYQGQVKPLRDGAGDFHVALFPAAP